jgi:pimeloyl-ACP methyl ester carboxylesterase
MDSMEQLRKFRAAHPCRYLTIGGIRWEYIASGGGAKTLLLLPGGMRIAESAFGYIELFEGKYRVLTPTYPPLADMAGLTDGIAAVLDAENAPRVSILSQSAGGIVAQVFAQRHAARVEKMVLCGTSTLEAPGWKTWILGAYNGIIPRLSEKMAVRLYRNMIQSVMGIPESQKPFWREYLEELFSTRLTKADVISHFRTGDDAIRKYGYGQPGVIPWPGEVLVLAGENDPVCRDGDRKAMAAFYPRAKVQWIPKAGHMPALSRPEEFRAAVEGFLSA